MFMNVQNERKKMYKKHRLEESYLLNVENV